MKKFVFALPLLFITSLVFSNPLDQDEKKIKYGFNLGINQSFLQCTEALPTNAKIYNGMGFQTGLFLERALSDNFSFTPLVEIAFNRSGIEYSNDDDYSINKSTADFALHLNYTIGNGKTAPYISVGPRYQIPIQKKTTSSSEYPNSSNFAIDFGIGLNQAFKFFTFAPELRYSMGLSNLTNPPSVPILNYHKLSLIFSFK